MSESMSTKPEIKAGWLVTDKGDPNLVAFVAETNMAFDADGDCIGGWPEDITPLCHLADVPGLLAELERLRKLVERAATECSVYVIDEDQQEIEVPGCFFCQTAPCTPECEARTVLGQPTKGRSRWLG